MSGKRYGRKNNKLLFFCTLLWFTILIESCLTCKDEDALIWRS